MGITVGARSGDREGATRFRHLDASMVVVDCGEGCEVRLPDPSVSHRHATRPAPNAVLNCVLEVPKCECSEDETAIHN